MRRMYMFRFIFLQNQQYVQMFMAGYILEEPIDPSCMMSLVYRAYTIIIIIIIISISIKRHKVVTSHINWVVEQYWAALCWRDAEHVRMINLEYRIVCRWSPDLSYSRFMKSLKTFVFSRRADVALVGRVTKEVVYAGARVESCLAWETQREGRIPAHAGQRELVAAVEMNWCRVKPKSSVSAPESEGERRTGQMLMVYLDRCSQNPSAAVASTCLFNGW